MITTVKFLSHGISCVCVSPALLSPDWEFLQGIAHICLSSQHRVSGREMLVALHWVREEWRHITYNLRNDTVLKPGLR